MLCNAPLEQAGVMMNPLDHEQIQKLYHFLKGKSESVSDCFDQAAEWLQSLAKQCENASKRIQEMEARKGKIKESFGDLSSDQRTMPNRFNILNRGKISDDDFEHDALIRIDGDFSSEERDQYVQAVCDALNFFCGEDDDG
mgnify:CR=1 FL=1